MQVHAHKKYAASCFTKQNCFFCRQSLLLMSLLTGNAGFRYLRMGNRPLYFVSLYSTSVILVSIFVANSIIEARSSTDSRSSYFEVFQGNCSRFPLLIFGYTRKRSSRMNSTCKIAGLFDHPLSS